MFSGVQPTGDAHIGNFHGAFKHWVASQDEFENIFCVVDLHAITVYQDPATLREQTRTVAVLLLAAGIDPGKSALFVQSHIGAHAELAWILNCFIPMGWLQRMTQFKEKAGEDRESVSTGLFDYPALMAADILLYDTDLVPVGDDQVQHIEVTRDIAERFNSIYGEVFVLPEARVLDSSAKVPGTDGEKMSKSYGNVIELFEPAKRVRKKVMSIKTDSTPVEDAKDPESCSVFDLYRLFADPTQVSELGDRYRAGGLGYGDAKQALFELSQEHFAEAAERRQLLESDEGTLEAILQAGAERARQKAGEVLGRARAACGLAG